MTILRTDSTHAEVKIDYANGSDFVHGGSGPLTVYSDDEKAAINALTDADDDTYYLFLVSSVTKLDADGNNTVVSGYMPVGYQHGFIFEQFDVARTYAHELSHGAFALHHTFSTNTESFCADEGTTTNLMDYTRDGIALNHKQWRWMHENHGKGLFGFLADEEEGEWTTDGHYYLFTYLGMLMGLDYSEAEKLGRYAEEPDSHVITDDDFTERDVTLPNGKSFHLKSGEVIMDDDVVVKIPDEYKIGDMMENTTWAIGGYQQRNHALTGGYHGVELAATAYAITHRDELGMQLDYEGYLLHRFGDVFAHFDIMNDATASIDNFINDYFKYMMVGDEVIRSDGKTIKMTAEQIIKTGDDKYLTTYSRDYIYSYVRNQILPSNGEIGDDNDIRKNIRSYITPSGMSDDVEYFDDVELKGYVDAIDKYITEKFIFKTLPVIGETNVTRPEFNGDKYVCYTNRNVLTKEIITTILTAKSQFSIISLDDIRDGILKHLPSASQNMYRMYGNGAKCISFTFGHKKDYSDPDRILRRPKLFMEYVKRSVELINMLYGEKVKNKELAIAHIQSIIDWGIEKCKSDDLYADARLDGIMSFMISLHQTIKDNQTYFIIPVKYWNYIFNNNVVANGIYIYNLFEGESFEKDADLQGMYLQDYLTSTNVVDKYNISCIKIVEKNDKHIKFEITYK